MFTKTILGTIALAALSTSALAADLPSRRAPPVFAPPPPVTAFSWTGYYIGANAGYAFDTDHTFNTFGNTPGQVATIANGTRPALVRDRSSGFTGGGEIGYNYQFANSAYFGGTGGVVVGIEADAAYDGPASNTNIVSGGLLSQFHSRTEFVGTVRGRLGYAFQNFLVYGTGGFAYAGVRDNVNFFNTVGLNTFSGNRNTIRTGYSFGGGVAYAIPTTSFLNFFHSTAVTLKAEFIRYDLGSTNLLVPATATANSYTTNIRTTGNLVRAGIDYKVDFFGGAPSSPVVARY